MINKQMLDKRICDCKKHSKDTQTYREFIRDSEKEFNLYEHDIDSYNDDNLDEYINQLYEYWRQHFKIYR